MYGIDRCDMMDEEAGMPMRDGPYHAHLRRM
jgi:hypothetical protein